jgi:hypothetical protein
MPAILTLTRHTTYLNGNGEVVHMVGPTRNASGEWWSIAGNHYDLSGRLKRVSVDDHGRMHTYFRRDSSSLVKVAEDQSWWEGIANDL